MGFTLLPDQKPGKNIWNYDFQDPGFQVKDRDPENWETVR